MKKTIVKVKDILSYIDWASDIRIWGEDPDTPLYEGSAMSTPYYLLDLVIDNSEDHQLWAANDVIVFNVLED